MLQKSKYKQQQDKLVRKSREAKLAQSHYYNNGEQTEGRRFNLNK